MKTSIRVLCSIVCLGLTAPMVPSVSRAAAATTYFSGSGTADSPYQITSEDDLIQLSALLSSGDTDTANAYAKAYYRQTSDITMSKDFHPIGTYPGVGFYGDYNGNYCSIYELDIQNSGSYTGVFGWVKGGTIHDLAVYGSVSSDGNDTGGIVGELCDQSLLKNCSFIGSVTSKKNNAGGLVGAIVRGSSISGCYFNGSVTGKECVGGITGIIADQGKEATFTIDHSYATGSAISSSSATSIGAIAGSYTFTNEKTTANYINLFYDSAMCNDAAINGKRDLSVATPASAGALRAWYYELGAPFVENNEENGFNNGFPIFKWQTTPYEFKGSGTKDDPYLITSRNELKEMRDLVNDQYFSSKYNRCCYAQTTDIDLQYEDWTPIGIRLVDGKEASRSFYGSYDGRCHEIRNLFVVRDEKFAGLFGSMNGNGTIENLTVTGEVNSSGNSAGGIIGEICNGGGTIKNCAFIGKVTGQGDGTGGIVGYLWVSGTVESCYSIGEVTNTGNHNAGGIVGHGYAGKYTDTDIKIQNCYHVGAVSGADGKAGSIIGLAEDLKETSGNVYISNCFALKGDAPDTANGSFTECDINEVPSNLMKSAYENLGKPFVKANSDEINNGYPVFEWQQSDEVKGDINNDGQFTAEDIDLLQKWLLGYQNIELANWKAADLREDGKLDACDFTLLKRLMLQSGNMEGFPKSIELNKSSVTLNIEGTNSSVQLTATVLPETVSDRSVKWTSSNPNVATVSEDGLVKAVSSGNAIITARANLGGKSAVCRVIVENPSIQISPSSVSLYVNGTSTLKATAVPSSATVSWKSDNTAVATVSGGKITAIAEGKANISASISVNGKTYTSNACVVTVNKAGISLSKTSVSLYPAGSETITATTIPKDQSVTWSTSDSKIATVSGGKITAVAAGTATITAKTTVNGKDYTATCTVTVNQPSIKLSKTSTTIYLAGNDTITATVTPSGQAVTWSTSDSKVATVSGGKISAVAAGTATITAKITVNGKDYSATCKVTVATPSIKLDKTSGTLYIAGTDKITATVVPSGTAVSWSTSDSKIATVNNGTVTFVAAGTATITAKISVNGKDYSATYKVTVKKPTISLSKTSHSMWIGDTVTLTGSTDPSNQSISWSSSNTGVATVSGGKVTGVGEGSATITGSMTVNGKSYSASCSVTIKKPYITLSSTSGSSKDDHVYYSSSTGGFYAGIFNLPTATCTPSGTATWSIASGNATINNGKLMINQPGTVVARASFSYGGKTYSADYTYTRTVTFYAGNAFNMRSAPSTSASIVTGVPKGTSLTLASLDYSDGTYVWGKATYNGKTGYLALWRKDRSESNGIITV